VFYRDVSKIEISEQLLRHPKSLTNFVIRILLSATHSRGMSVLAPARFYLRHDHGAIVLSSQPSEDSGPTEDRDECLTFHSLLASLRELAGQANYVALTVRAGDGRSWASDSGVRWSLLYLAIRHMTTLRRITLCLETVSNKEELGDEWWSEMVAHLPPSVISLQIDGLATDMPMTIAAMIHTLPAIASLTITSHQERFMQTGRARGLSDTFCLQLSHSFRSLSQLRSLVVLGLVVMDPASAWTHLAKGMFALERLRHVEIGGGWTWGAAPPGLQLFLHSHTFVPYIIQPRINQLGTFWVRANMARERVQLTAQENATPSQLNILAMVEVNVNTEFDLFHYFLTQLEGAAYLPL
jgi:hypothetical protein